MTDTNPAKIKKLVTLLRELFQLDQPDLDFGIYRIMHAKAGEVTQFLERDLLPQVKQAFAQYQSADSVVLRKELDELEATLRRVKVDPDTNDEVRKLREQMKSAIDIGALENEVYDHLYSFFRRYYSEGDFLAKRVYKPGVYAIPYEGEEVTLHWANKDQYYIKTSEYLRDYAFRLRPEAADGQDPMRVHFRLVDAAEGEHGNVKAAEGKDRVFILAKEDFIGLANGELDIRFEYRPAALEDWPEGERAGKSKPPAQKELTAMAVERILASPSLSRAGEGRDEGVLTDWLSELNGPHIKADGEQADYTRLEAHLRRYTARNTFDYFIHKDLGGFLRRELDFYIKSEVMHLDDVENETAPKVEQYLSKIKVIRRIASKVIDFLAQLENFQKKLWLKKKFVIDSNYLIVIDLVPQERWDDVLRNQPQIEDWVATFGIEKAALNRAFLATNRSLVVDTRHFPREWVDSVIAGLESIDQVTQGIAVHCDNFQALRLIEARYSGAVQTVYIDPPFNTGDDFFYKDAYRFSSWNALMRDRIAMCRKLLRDSGSMYLHLDHNANYYGRILLNQEFGAANYINEIVWRIGWVSGYKTQVDAFVRNHDTIFLYAKSERDHYFRKADSRIPYRSFERTTVSDELDAIIRKWGIDKSRLSNIKISLKYPSGEVFKLGLTKKEAGYNIEDTWNCSEYEELNSNKIKRNAAEYTPNGSKLTQKPEDLLKRVIELTSDEGDVVLDCFAGSGTTAAVAWKLGRKFVTTEVESHFDEDVLWRIKRVFWGQHPVGISRYVPARAGKVCKYLRLESYEDTLNNLVFSRSTPQQAAIDFVSHDVGSLREQYLLHYQLDFESRSSASLLNVRAFSDPAAYKLKVKAPGSDESREVTVDLLETFNWLLGLTVQQLTAPRSFRAEFERDDEGRLQLKGRLRQSDDGPFWFRTVTGTTPEGRKTLVIWRKLTGEPEQDNLVLEEWFKNKQAYSVRDAEFDLIYVNGDNTLENLRVDPETWKVRLIEEDFHRLMFEGTEA